MAVPNDSLFKLIRSLKKPEQNDFWEQLKHGIKGEKNHPQRLFQEIVRMKIYDEQALKKKFKEISDNQFAVQKNKLRTRLLNYLSEKRNSIHKELHQELDHIEILIGRELYAEAYDFCERVKEKAKKHGYLYIAFEANYREGPILQHAGQGALTVTSQELAAESMEIIEHIRLTLLAGRYYLEVASLVHDKLDVRNGTFRRQVAALKENPLFSLDTKAKTYPFYLVCYLAMARCQLYKMMGKFEESYLQEKEVWDKIRADWKFYFDYKVNEVLSSVINYADALHLSGHRKEFQAHLHFIETLLSGAFQNNQYLHCVLMLFRLADAVEIRNDTLTESNIADFVSFYKSGALDRYESEKKEYTFYLGRAFFSIGDYDRAGKYLYSVNDEYKRDGIRPDMNEYALFMHLINEVTQSLGRPLDETKDHIRRVTEPYANHIRRREYDDYRIEILFMDFFNVIKHKKSDTQEWIKALSALERQLYSLLAERSGYIQFMKIFFDFDLILKRWGKLLNMEE